MVTLLPKQLRFLLADAVREETGGKLTLLGLYTGDEVVLQGTLPVDTPKGMKGIALQGLTILVLIVDGYGEFNVQIQVYDPTGAPIGESSKDTLVKVKDVPQNMLLPITPFPVRAFGRHRLEIQLNNRKYEYLFTVRHQDPNARLPTAPGQVTTKRKSSQPRQREVKKSVSTRLPKK